ncbi:MAG: hypothetical protein AMS26_13605 [Bacteroides sp. SM23_62]|nr:MAG: hypothetical protein AMS26_13605 [Bacteroides sp. SM23_62]
MKKSKTGFLIIASAIVWAAVILGCAMVLKDSPYKDEINRIIVGVMLFHLLFIWAPLGSELRKRNKES